TRPSSSAKPMSAANTRHDFAVARTGSLLVSLEVKWRAPRAAANAKRGSTRARRLERQRHAEQAAVVAVAADDHQPDRRRARRMDRQGDGATVEKVDNRGI